MPPSIPPIFVLISSSTFLAASFTAATTMSCSISTSPATSGSIRTDSRFFWPSMCAVTMPPPAVASTLMSAISWCSFSCIFCACCIICCMLPGSFTSLLLEVSNFADLAAKDFPKTPDLFVAQRAPGEIVFFSGGRGCRRGGLRRFADADLDPQGLSKRFPDRRFKVPVLQIELVRLGRHNLQFRTGYGHRRVLYRIGKMREPLLAQMGVQPLAGILGQVCRRCGRWRARFLGVVQLERRRSGFELPRGANGWRRRWCGKSGFGLAHLRQRLLDRQQPAGLHEP